MLSVTDKMEVDLPSFELFKELVIRLSVAQPFASSRNISAALCESDLKSSRPLTGASSVSVAVEGRESEVSVSDVFSILVVISFVLSLPTAQVFRGGRVAQNAFVRKLTGYTRQTDASRFMPSSDVA